MNLLQKILDVVFPHPPHLRYIEHMSPETFLVQAHKPLEDPLPPIQSLFAYRDPLVEQALWHLKYRGSKNVAALFAHILYDVLLEELADKHLFSHFIQPILIPIPLSKERLKERGWNQTEMIARELERLDRSKNFVVQTTILYKKRHTASQTKLNRDARIKNLKGCFVIPKPELVFQKNIILIDDVTTTGSTLFEAIEVLKAHGAKEVIAFTIAH